MYFVEFDNLCLFLISHRRKRKAEDSEKEKRQKKVRKEIFTKLGKVKQSQVKKMSYYEAAE